MRKTSVVYLLLGSNLGDRERYLELAREMIESLPECRALGASSVLESEAEGLPPGAGPFLNQVVSYEADARPLDLLENLEEIERQLGRKDKGQALARTIDIDILLYGNFVIDSERLTVPHRELPHRIFALEPLLELQPDLVDPRNARAYAIVLNELSSQQAKPHTQHVRQN